MLPTYQNLFEIPFDPRLQYHAGLFKHNQKGIAYIIGAPELLMSKSKEISGKSNKFLNRLLKDGLRVVAVASLPFDLELFPHKKHVPADVCFDIAKSFIENGNLSLLGLFGIQDSIRPEVPEMVEKAREAGLLILMATGDHKDTALYVAKEVNIFKEGNIALTGKEFAQMSDEQLLPELQNITVYARMRPKEKMRLIKLFHKNNKIIAMTGDGINDAPALVAADLGIAMGGIGTEVAKKASDMILLDDSFVNIIRAIEQVRHIMAELSNRWIFGCCFVYGTTRSRAAFKKMATT